MESYLIILICHISHRAKFRQGKFKVARHWPRGSGLDFGSDDSGLIPGLPSPRVGPLMARR